jgi:hypothetical protein
MKITLDRNRFDELQLALLEELIRAVRDGLREAGVTDDDTLFDATGNLAFAIAAIVDGSRVMQLDGEPVVPVLTFAGEPGSSELIGAEGGSWMHEYVFGSVEDVFDDEDEDDDSEDDDLDEDEDEDDAEDRP